MNWLKTHRNDVFLIAVLAVLCGALALYLWFARQTGGIVTVQMDGEIVMELPLNKDTQVVLGEGADTNTLVIEGGKARVVEASCPDQVCVRQGGIQYEGESIVCLPHRLIVTVEGGIGNGVDGSAG